MLYLKIFLASLIAGGLDTFVGFAGAFLLLPALTLILGSGTDAVVLSSVISLGWNGVRTVALRKLADWPSALLLSAGVVPGALLGAFLFAGIHPQVLHTVVAAVLIAGGVYYVARLYVDMPESGGWVRRWMLAPLGFVTGGISAVIGAGNGPLNALSLSSQLRRRMPQALAATTGVVGCATALVRIGGYNVADVFRHEFWLAGVAGLAGAATGALLALNLKRGAHDSTLDLVIGLVIAVAGIRLLF